MGAELQELARRMLADYDARMPGLHAGEPFGLTTVQPYTLQADIARLREDRGEKVIGYKLGCTSRPIQAQLGVNEPIFGRLWGTECHTSGVHLSSARYANLAVEGEMAVRLGKDLAGAAVSPVECREAIESVFPVIELHHYVLPSAWPHSQWLVATGGLHAGFVLAETETRLLSSAHPANGLSIRINEVLVGAVEDAGSPTCIVESVRWLAGRLAQFGLQLCKGQVILTGSPMQLYPVIPGSRIVVEAPTLGASCVEIDP
jgi:2-keto-4-pentenoate hydratase